MAGGETAGGTGFGAKFGPIASGTGTGVNELLSEGIVGQGRIRHAGEVRCAKLNARSRDSGTIRRGIFPTAATTT